MRNLLLLLLLLLHATAQWRARLRFAKSCITLEPDAEMQK